MKGLLIVTALLVCTIPACNNETTTSQKPLETSEPAKIEIKTSDYICITTELNIRETPKKASQVLDKVHYGDRLQLAADKVQNDDAPGQNGEGWTRIRTQGGKEGWAFDLFLIPEPVFESLSPYIARIKSVSANADITPKPEDVIPVSTEKIFLSPRKNAVAIYFEDGEKYKRPCYIVLVAGQGALMSLYAYPSIKFEWSADGHFAACDEGTDTQRLLSIFDVANQQKIKDDGVWSDTYQFVGSTVIYWQTYTHLGEKDLAKPEFINLMNSLKTINESGGVTLPLVMAMDCQTGSVYTVYEPDFGATFSVEDHSIKVPMERSGNVPDNIFSLIPESVIKKQYQVRTDSSQG